VYDVAGNHVETLLQKTKNISSGSINWQPNNMEKTVYFVVLQTENLYRVKKVML
jgi:hypothetical protein